MHSEQGNKSNKEATLNKTFISFNSYFFSRSLKNGHNTLLQSQFLRMHTYS